VPLGCWGDFAFSPTPVACSVHSLVHLSENLKLSLGWKKMAENVVEKAEFVHMVGPNKGMFSGSAENPRKDPIEGLWKCIDGPLKGGIYKGQFKSGLRHGKGTWTQGAHGRHTT